MLVGHRPDAIRSQVEKGADASKPSLEDQGAGAVLPSGVPGPHDEDEAGADAALEEALERAEGDELGEVAREADAQHGEAPEDDVQRQDAAHRVPLQQHHGRQLEEQVRDVEDGRQPGELLAHEARVLAQAERRLRADAALVHRLQAVAEEHEREQVPVHLAPEPPVFFVRVPGLDVLDLAGGDLRRLNLDVVLGIHFRGEIWLKVPGVELLLSVSLRYAVVSCYNPPFDLQIKRRSKF